MTVDNFCEKLSERYPNIGAASLSDSRNFLSDFVEKDLDSIWGEFLDTYTANFPPKRAEFVKIAGKLSVSKIHRAQAWQYVCYICTAKLGRTFKYPVDRQSCPQCGNHERPFYALIDTYKDTSVEYARRLLEQYSTVQGEYQVVEDRRLPYKDE